MELDIPNEFSQSEYEGKAFTEVVCVVLLYDISSETSFKLATEHMFPKVSSLINNEYQFTMLIGNKLDLEDNHREIEFERASDFTQNNDIMFSEVSSLKRKKIEMVLRMIRNRCSALIEKHPNLNEILGGNTSSVLNEELEEMKLVDSALQEDRIIS